MKVPALPLNEAARLETLRNLAILDTGQEPAFDAIVELASSLCNAPIAAISLVEAGRQWFKATKGFGGVTETSRDVSFCGHVVADGHRMVVADAQLDERFADNPIVTGSPYIRFYAGTPLTTQSGHTLGTLCVLDSKPGELTAAQRDGLDRLALVALRLIESRVAEARHRESERRFIEMADNAPVMIWMTGRDSRVEFINRRWQEFTGLDLAEANTWIKQVHPDDLDTVRNASRTAQASLNGYRLEWRMRNAAGDYRWLLSEAQPRHDANNRFLGFVGSSIDITDERRARRELERAEERLRLIVLGSNDAPWDLDVATNTYYYSPRWWAILGYQTDELPSDNALWQSLVHPEDAERIAQMIASAEYEGKTSFEMEYRLRHKAGHYVPVLARGNVVRDSEHRALRFSGTLSDLTERKRAEESRNQALALLRNVAARIPGVVYQFRMRSDGTSCFPYASDALRDIYGVDPADAVDDATAVFSSLHPDDLAAVAASIEESRQQLTPWNLEYRVRYADGRVRWLHGNALPQREEAGSVLWHGFITDCTARKEAELERESLAAQLRESQKMQAIGTLAGGIAHDFNNIAGAILGNAELARQDAGDNAEVLQSLEQIRKAAERARDLTRQILTFSRRQPTHRQVIALQPRIEDIVKLVQSTLLAPVTIACQFDPNVPAVLADRIQIDQILINLLTNAAQALDGKPGRIDIRLDAVERHARITIQDSGQGMDAATLERIFEPFYTTKPVDQGTGLGLSVVYGIMQAHQGTVTVASELGKGSTFTLLFPAAQSPLTPELPLPATAGRDTTVRDQRILYIDDDESLRFLVKRMLERRGFRVTGAASGEEGLEILGRDPAAFDLLLVDYNMPGLTGIDVARQVRQLRPDLPIAIASGFITDEMRSQAEALDIRDLIFKPNAANEYCDVVDRLIRSRS